MSVSINGMVDLKTTGAGLANMPVEVNWFKKGYCIGCTAYKITSGKSGKDGKFSFNIAIDTSFFKDYYLSVRVAADSNYISASAPGQDFNEERFYDSTSTSFQNIKLEFYPKTYLTIHLHRTLADTFSFFSVEHSFEDRMKYQDYIISGSQFATDDTIKVETSSGIYTRIISTKIFGVGQAAEQTDSLIARPNGINVFDINY